MAHSRAAASAALHTPTDLSADATSAIIEVLNPLVADALLLYVKTKNFHQHVTGPSQLGFEIGAHALRATAATNALDHQADIAKVQEWLGHANIATTRIYDHPKTRPEDSPSGDIWPQPIVEMVSTLKKVSENASGRAFAIAASPSR